MRQTMERNGASISLSWMELQFDEHEGVKIM
jgi:hypothetical protein